MVSHPAFSATVMEHFLHPRHTQPIDAPDGTGWSGSIETHRFMRIQVSLRNNIIHNAAFGTYGCAPAIAAGSYLCEWSIGRSVQDVTQLQADDLLHALGGLPEPRRFCAALAIDAFRDALHQATRPDTGPDPP